MAQVTELDVLTEKTLGSLKVQRVSERGDPPINLLIYGNSGVGKTLLAGSASEVPEMSPVLLIDIEGGVLTLREKYPGIEVVRVKSWRQIQEVYDALRKGEGGYKTVVLDSLTEIQKFSMYTIMTELKAKGRPSGEPVDEDVPSMREWGKNIEQTRRLVRAFRDLPINSIFTALATTDKDAKTGVMHTKPYLSGKLSGEVAGFLDIVLYYYIKAVEGRPQRLLLSTGTEQQIAKDRSDRLPPILLQPTMQDIYSHIFNPTATTTQEQGAEQQ